MTGQMRHVSVPERTLVIGRAEGHSESEYLPSEAFF